MTNRPPAYRLGLWTAVMALVLALWLPQSSLRAEDRRSQIVLRYECWSTLARREVTLFANGTLRLWDGPHDEPRMDLSELSPSELEGFVNRLAELDLSESSNPGLTAVGEWVERCRVELPREGRETVLEEFGRYDSLSLSFSRLVGIARELDQLADERKLISRLPVGYRPKLGDVLRRADDLLFRIVGLTADKRGVELQGIDDPLVVYVDTVNLPLEFVELVRRRAGS